MAVNFQIFLVASVGVKNMVVVRNQIKALGRTLKLSRGSSMVKQIMVGEFLLYQASIRRKLVILNLKTQLIREKATMPLLNLVLRWKTFLLLLLQ